MIRQDYLMRLAQRLAQALAQAVFRRQRQDYEGALDEIRAALTECFGIEGEQELTLDDLVKGCSGDGPRTADNLVRLADLLSERGDIQRLRGDEDAAGRSNALALGLCLEVLQTSLVTVDLIDKAERLIERTRGVRMPVPVLKRLLSYYEARGMFARAEEVLREWSDTKDPGAPEAGLAFARRPESKPENEVDRGGLPPA